MLINIIVAVLILLGGISFSISTYKKSNNKIGVVCYIIASISLSVASSFVTDDVKQIVSSSNTTISNVTSDPKTLSSGDGTVGDMYDPDTEDVNSKKRDDTGPAGSAPGLKEEDESNSDNRSNGISRYARDIVLGDTIDSSIFPEGNMDFFKFTLSASGQISLDILSYMQYYTLIIYDMAGTEIWYTDNNEFNETVGFREDTYKIDLESGNYFLKVTGYKYGTSYASTGSYTIKTSFLPANANEIEPNNKASEATHFNLGDLIRGLIGENDRFDFYEFTLPQSGRACFDITSYMRYYTLILYDATGTEIWYSDNNEYNSTVGFREDIHYVDLESGDFFLKVTGYKYGNDYASTGSYIIDTTFVSADANEIESNNSSSEANQVSFGNPIRGLIGVNDKLDFYKFTLSKPEQVIFDITSYMKYYCIFLYDAMGSQLWYTDSNEINEISGSRSDIYEFDLENGTYYISITGYKYGDSYPSTGNYTITITI